MLIAAEKALSFKHNAGYKLLQPNPDQIDAAKKAKGCIYAILQAFDTVQGPSWCWEEHNRESFGSEAEVSNH